jgi:hypothetical protein
LQFTLQLPVPDDDVTDGIKDEVVFITKEFVVEEVEKRVKSLVSGSKYRETTIAITKDINISFFKFIAQIAQDVAVSWSTNEVNYMYIVSKKKDG